jgi:hypothetical protein
MAGENRAAPQRVVLRVLGVAIAEDLVFVEGTRAPHADAAVRIEQEARIAGDSAEGDGGLRQREQVGGKVHDANGKPVGLAGGRRLVLHREGWNEAIGGRISMGWPSSSAARRHSHPSKRSSVVTRKRSWEGFTWRGGFMMRKAMPVPSLMFVMLRKLTVSEKPDWTVKRSTEGPASACVTLVPGPARRGATR